MLMQTKIIAILLVLAGAVLVADGVVERSVMMPKFEQLERQEALRNVQRVREAIGREVEQLARTARDYGTWDDACRFLRTRDSEFIRSSLSPEAFKALGVNLIQFYDASGALVWSESRDAATGELLVCDEIRRGVFPPEQMRKPQASPLLGVSGLAALGSRFALVAAEPIVDSRRAGPVRGTIVFARLFSNDDQLRLRRQTQVDFALLSPQTPHAAADAVTFENAGQRSLLLSTTLAALDGSALRTLRIDQPRNITAEGTMRIWKESAGLLAMMAALVAGTYACFGWFVIRPVRRLIDHVGWVRQSGDFARRIDVAGRDEVAALAAEFNLLLSQVARSRAARLRVENQMKAVLQDNTDLIRRFLPDGTTTFVNRTYARFLGASEETLVGRGDALPVAAEDRDAYRAHIEALRVAPVAELLHRVVLPGGEVRWLHWTSRAICDADGAAVEFQSVGRDVTAQKQAAAADAPAQSGATTPILPLGATDGVFVAASPPQTLA